MNAAAAKMFYGIIAAVCALCFLVMLFLWLIKRENLKKIKTSAWTDPESGALSQLGFSETWSKKIADHLDSVAVVSMHIAELSHVRSVLGIDDYRKTLRLIVEILALQLGPGEPAARTGENSFCFMIHSRKQDEIYMKLRSVSKAVASLIPDSNFHFSLHPVYGVYLPEKDEDIRELCVKAASVRPISPSDSNIIFSDRAQLIRAQKDRETVSAMLDAIQNKEFIVFYQPKIGLADSRIIGAEALVRWRHPQKGMLIPDMFLPLLERYNAVPMLDRFVWKETCRLLARLKREGKELFPISVNISASDLENEEISEQIYELCCQYEIEPAYIEIECKERHMLKHPELAKDQIDRLRRYGFRFAFDNFGIDYTSLSLLGTLEPDTVKLDKSFFSGSNNSRQGRTILDTLLRQSAQLHITTVAEGVESSAQVQYLQQAACDIVQGFFYFKPMPADRLISEIYDGKYLKTISTSDENSDLLAGRSEQNFELSQKTSQNIILFTYWPNKDLVEFSDTFSPLLDGNICFERAGTFFRTSNLIYENDKKDFFALLDRSKTASGWVENTLRFYGMARRYEWMEVRLKREVIGSGERIMGMLVNMAGWRNEINRWKEKATRDPMTGVYNKEYFEQAAVKSLENANYKYAAMIFIDMDSFKQANDTFGHVFGDDVLRYLAKQLLSIFRHSDIIARYGGDEFMVFAPSMEPAVLKDRLERLYKVFSYPYRSENKEFRISVSIGAAFYGIDASNYDELLNHADCAVYEAKERGKNQFVFYEPYMLGDQDAKDPSDQ